MGQQESNQGDGSMEGVSWLGTRGAGKKARQGAQSSGPSWGCCSLTVSGSFGKGKNGLGTIHQGAHESRRGHVPRLVHSGQCTGCNPPPQLQPQLSGHSTHLTPAQLGALGSHSCCGCLVLPSASAPAGSGRCTSPGSPVPIKAPAGFQPRRGALALCCQEAAL